MQLVLPKTLVPEGLIEPIFFTVGPIKGGDDWQHRACLLLQQRLGSRFSVVVPCRWDSGHPLHKFRVPGLENEFERQTPWERVYLEMAGEEPSVKGCIIAWLPCESKTNPRDDGQPYARDSYGEIGEWRGRMMRNPRIRFALGIEEGFPGRDVISRNFNGALEKFAISTTLEDTVDCAIAIARGGKAYGQCKPLLATATT